MVRVIPGTRRQSGTKRFKRVWFVGAGFTTAVGYPLGSSLVAAIVNYLEDDRDELLRNAPRSVRKRFVNSVADDRLASDRRSILRSIDTFSHRYLARRLRDLGQVEVAEFFSIAQALAEQQDLLTLQRSGRSRRDRFVAEADREGSLATVYADIASVTRSYFVDLCGAVGKWPSDFRSILEGVVPEEDAIVNFNWDEEVDCFLCTERDEGTREYDAAYTVGSWQNDRFLILKPHGSIGWYDVAQGIANPEIYFIADECDSRIPRIEKRLISYTGFDLPQDIAEDADERKDKPFVTTCPPAITPPTFGKRFPYPEQRWIWRDVIDTCRNAEQFVFLGYSVPQDDFLTRAAIRCALENRGTGAKPVSCLVVTKLDNEDPQQISRVIRDFAAVFGRGFVQRNVFPWTFGRSRPSAELFQIIMNQLREATV